MSESGRNKQFFLSKRAKPKKKTNYKVTVIFIGMQSPDMSSSKRRLRSSIGGDFKILIS